MGRVGTEVHGLILGGFLPLDLCLVTDTQADLLDFIESKAPVWPTPCDIKARFGWTQWSLRNHLSNLLDLGALEYDDACRCFRVAMNWRRSSQPLDARLWRSYRFPLRTHLRNVIRHLSNVSGPGREERLELIAQTERHLLELLDAERLSEPPDLVEASRPAAIHWDARSRAQREPEGQLRLFPS